MMEINVDISKKELLDKLATLANIKEKLVIKVESLPNFLSSQISFTIFNYQISNYPRQITWTSDDQDIINFFKDCGASFSTHESNPEPEAKEEENSAKPSTQIISTSSKPSYKVDNLNQYTSRSVIDSSSVVTNTNQFILPEEVKALSEPEIIIPTNTVPEAIPSSSREDYNFDSFFNNSIPSEAIKTQSSISSRNFFKADGYRRSSLLDADYVQESVPENSSFIPDSTSTILSDQNLDSWLDRIEATRLALNNISQSSTTTKTGFHKSNLWQFAVASFTLTVIIVGFLVIFPTNVYSINLVPIQKNQTTQIQLSSKDFLKNSTDLNTTVTSQTTEQKEIVLEQAEGEVTIINKSGGDVSFSKNGIILVSDSGLEYKQIAKASDPNTITVPANSSRNGGNVITTIQASRTGTNYGLAVNAKLKVYNLKRDLLGGNIEAIVTKEIKNSKFDSSKIVSEKTYAELNDLYKADLNKQIETKISDYKSNNNFTNSKWFTIKSTNKIYSSEIGQTANEVTLTVKSNVEVYFLNNDILTTVLKKENSGIDKIKEISIINQEGSFDTENSIIKLKLDYGYLTKDDIDNQRLTQTFANKNLTDATSELQKQYPSIQSIKKEQSGLSMPGVPSKIDININNQSE